MEVVVALAQPTLWLILFGNLFSQSGLVTGSSYISFMTAGVVVMTVFNAALEDELSCGPPNWCGASSSGRIGPDMLSEMA